MILENHQTKSDLQEIQQLLNIAKNTTYLIVHSYEKLCEK